MRDKIRQLFSLTDVDAVILANGASADANFYYFSGLQYDAFPGSVLVLKRASKQVLLLSPLEQAQSSKNLRVREFSSKADFEKAVGKELKVKKIGFNGKMLQSRRLKKIRALKGKRFVNLSRELEKVRAIKTGKEVSCIRKAAKISQNAFDCIQDCFRRGMTEKQLALKLEFMLRENADNSIAFPLIVASGKNSAFPHHVPSGKRIKSGFLLVDLGCRYRNYCSDLSRTFFVGRAAQREKEIYETVFNAKQLAEENIKPKAGAARIFSRADEFLRKETGKRLVHGLGHGLGIEVHDSPAGFTAESKTVLEENMVFTVEPAFYGKRFGVRIEDDVLVTRQGCRKLSSAPCELVEL